MTIFASCNMEENLHVHHDLRQQPRKKPGLKSQSSPLPNKIRKSAILRGGKSTLQNLGRGRESTSGSETTRTKNMCRIFSRVCVDRHINVYLLSCRAFGPKYREYVHGMCAQPVTTKSQTSTYSCTSLPCRVSASKRGPSRSESPRPVAEEQPRRLQGDTAEPSAPARSQRRRRHREKPLGLRHHTARENDMRT